MTPLLLLLSLPPAHALSCLDGPGETLPLDGATAVPTDVMIRVGVYWSAAAYTVHLLDGEGQEVPMEQSLVDNPGVDDVLVGRPVSPLDPEATYTITAAHVDSNQPWELASFTTGSAAAEGAARAPELLDVGRSRGRDIWGAWDWITLDIEGRAPSSFLVEIASNADFSDAREVHVMDWTGGVGATTLSVGDGVCGGNAPLLDGERFVRVAAVDYAGRVSDFVEAEGPARCASAPGGTAGLMGILGALMALRVRTRSRR